MHQESRTLCWSQALAGLRVPGQARWQLLLGLRWRVQQGLPLLSDARYAGQACEDPLGGAIRTGANGNPDNHTSPDSDPYCHHQSPHRYVGTSGEPDSIPDEHSGNFSDVHPHPNAYASPNTHAYEAKTDGYQCRSLPVGPATAEPALARSPLHPRPGSLPGWPGLLLCST